MKYWIGEYIRTYRNDSKLTQETLGQVAHVSQGQMSKIENCEADIGFHELLTMLRFMGRNMNDVLNGYDPAPIVLGPKGGD